MLLNTTSIGSCVWGRDWERESDKKSEMREERGRVVDWERGHNQTCAIRANLIRWGKGQAIHRAMKPWRHSCEHVQTTPLLLDHSSSARWRTRHARATEVCHKYVQVFTHTYA